MNTFHPCPGCAQELGLGGVPPAPGKHRHAVSDPAERNRKELTQCQHCYKSRASGAVLQKCAACKVDLYCSKECQKKAWPTHKSKCKLNQAIASSANTDQFDVLKNIRAFTSKHRPTITEASIRALEVCVDPSRAVRDVVLIFLSTRSGPCRTETMFYATSANVVPFEAFGPKAEEMRGQLKLANDSNRRAGMTGTLLAVLWHTSAGAVNICPIGFGEDIKAVMYPGMPWKEWMLNRLNEGIVT